MILRWTAAVSTRNTARQSGRVPGPAKTRSSSARK
jgi:hypothetical protein